MIIKVPKELTKEQALIIKEEFQNEYKNRFVMVFATEKDNNIAIEVTKINR